MKLLLVACLASVALAGDHMLESNRVSDDAAVKWADTCDECKTVRCLLLFGVRTRNSRAKSGTIHPLWSSFGGYFVPRLNLLDNDHVSREALIGAFFSRRAITEM